MAVGKKVILRSIPYWKEVGTEKFIEAEEARYICSECGNKVFRGVIKCNKCKTKKKVYTKLHNNANSGGLATARH
ncbi:MAG: hypothetical protein B6240_14040 [Desulfobacteraceae bacterium 4572_87]|nr:MAG: hypothetical protein B6240_14040 [Desulfobacteraceae bacterium 4572_87]